MAQYMLLIKGFNDGAGEYSPEEMQKLLEKFDGWVESIRAQEKLRGAQKLKDEVRVSVSTREGRVLDGPFPETKETIGGFFIIECDEIEEAISIARDCPVLLQGGSVEVRELWTDKCRYSK